MIRTERLDMVPARPEDIQAALAGRAELAAALGADVPPTWPPEFLDEDALRFFLDRLRAAPDEAPWWGYFLIARGGDGRALVGSAGYKGPPAGGTVEIGYGVVSDRRRQGYASEAARALTARAFADPRVDRVIAETFPELLGSVGVLKKCGFRLLDEPASEPGAIRFGLTRPGDTIGGR